MLRSFLMLRLPRVGQYTGPIRRDPSVPWRAGHACQYPFLRPDKDELVSFARAGISILERSLALARIDNHVATMGKALRLRSLVLLAGGDLRTAARLTEEAFTAACTLDGREPGRGHREVAGARNVLAASSFWQRESAMARQRLEERLGSLRLHGDAFGIVLLLANLSSARDLEGTWGRARDLAEQAVVLA